MATVLIVDDNQTFADALQMAIDGDPDLTCVGIAHDLDEAIDVAQQRSPTRCLIDLELDLPGSDGMAVIRALRRAAPDMAVTVLTMRTDADVVREADVAGASSLVHKRASIRDVLATLRSPDTGRMVVAGNIVVDLLDRRPPSSRGGGPGELTAREREILTGMAQGAVPKSIAVAMGISVHTVRGHVKNIYWKLDAHNQLEAVAIARRRGVISSAG